MNRARLVFGLIAYALLAALALAAYMIIAPLVGASGSTSEPEMPTVEFLGEGPETFNNESGDFVVKTKNTPDSPWGFVVESGPSYSARRGERVWSITEGASAPMRLFEQVYELGMVEEGCRIEYVIIDDDEDDRSTEFINLGTVPEGMVSYGAFQLTETRMVTLVTEDSIGLWYGVLCEPPTPVEYKIYMPIVAGPSLPRGELSFNTTVYCTEEGFVQGFAWTRNDSTVYWVNVNVQFSGWGFDSARLEPGKEHTFRVNPNLSSVPAGTLHIDLQWENGDTQTIEVPFEALDCTPPGWVVVHVERDPWVWSTQFDWEFVPMWFQPPKDELRLVSIPVGRDQLALRTQGHEVTIDVVEWYDQQFVSAVYLDDVEVETASGEIAEVVIEDENGVAQLAVFVGEGCGENLCQNPMVWWKVDPLAEGLLVDLANNW